MNRAHDFNLGKAAHAALAGDNPPSAWDDRLRAALKDALADTHYREGRFLLVVIMVVAVLSLATDLARRDCVAPPPGDKLTDGAATAGGAFLTGLLGVGVGEVVLPQISRDRPLPQAAGTSVAVVAGTAAAAAVTQVAELDATEVPWELVRYTIPGVILGGQIAPRLAGRLDDRQIERAAAALFAVVGAAFEHLDAYLIASNSRRVFA